MSMNHPLSTLAPRILLASLLYCLPCIPALAESQLEFEEAETEAADDENVEDIESSKPLRKNIDHARKISHPDQGDGSQRDCRARTRARAKNRNGNNTQRPPRGYANCIQ